MNTIEFLYMKWSNMFSYGEDNFVDFNSERLVQIVGTNGAGKSSIPLILEEGLYNKNSKGFKKAAIPNRHKKEPYSMEIGFTKDDSQYVINVTKASALKASITKDKEDISKHTASATIKMFEEISGMPFKIFTQLVYQNTDSSLEFLTSTDSKRKEFLISLFDLDEYSEKYKIFSEALKVEVQQLRVLEGKLQATQDSLDRNLALASKNTDAVLEDVPPFPEHLLSEKAGLESKLEGIEQENKKIVRSNKVLSDLSKLRSSEEIEKDLEDLGSIESKTPLLELIGQKNAQISGAKIILDKVSTLGNKCHTCLQDIDQQQLESVREENSSIIDESRQEARNALSKVKDIEEREKILKTLKFELNQRNDLESRLIEDDYLETLDYEDLEFSIEDLESQLTEARKSIDDIIRSNKLAEESSTRIKIAQEEVDSLTTALMKYEDELAEIDKKKVHLEVLKKAFGPQGLVAYKLENMVLDLEMYTNQYLSKLSDGKFNLTFELEKDKLNVIILDEEESVSIVSLSSGERARVVIGTLLGIRRLMQDISNTTVNLLFLDEVISVMDDEGKEQLVEVLLEEESLNTFLVSHSWTHPLVRTINVVKEGNISVIDG